MVNVIECTALESLKHSTSYLKSFDNLQWGLFVCSAQVTLSNSNSQGASGYLHFALHNALYAKTSFYHSVGWRALLSGLKS